MDSVVEYRSDNWKYFKGVRYKNFHPIYASRAVAWSASGNYPRARYLRFCIGDEYRTLIGEAGVGGERADTSKIILNMLKTLRFIDKPASKP